MIIKERTYLRELKFARFFGLVTNNSEKVAEMLRNCGIDKKHYEVDYRHVGMLEEEKQKTFFSKWCTKEIREVLQEAKKEIAKASIEDN
jgi:predicted nucleotidyltransferase